MNFSDFFFNENEIAHLYIYKNEKGHYNMDLYSPHFNNSHYKNKILMHWYRILYRKYKSLDIEEIEGFMIFEIKDSSLDYILRWLKNSPFDKDNTDRVNNSIRIKFPYDFTLMSDLL